MDLTGKKILVTGGTGSFGRAFIHRLLRDHQVEKVVVFSRDEWKQWEMRRADPLFDDGRMRYFLGDVRDRERLRRAFHEIDIVIHAAALKQVPAAEYNPSEFIQTNVVGAMNVIDAAIDEKVEKVVALSTDKAVNPVNLYGATKLCADKLFVAGNVYVGSSGKPKLSVVRYGNVLGSRGSIIPMWQEMVAGGASALPITDRRMTRFWLTVDEGVEMVLHALDAMVGGEIFVPKLPSMKIVDLAEAIAPGIALNEVGIRAGEKVHEVLISPEDAPHTYSQAGYYVIAPRVCEPAKALGEPLPAGFAYTSDRNERWLSAEDLRSKL